MNFYNEWDKDAAQWTRELIKAGLIPDGDVDERSITEVKAHELTGYTQCHFFAGISGWPIAFQLAGIPPDENTDTGSCPCQPFSGTGKQMGFADPRHLWPAFRRVIGKRQSATVYGEQVASKLGRDWLSRVFSDLAFMGYAGSGADLCSAGVGSPNIRQRLYWVGDAVFPGSLPAAQRGENRGEESGGARDGIFERSGATDRLANPAGQRLGETRSAGGGQTERTGGGCSALRLADTPSQRLNGISGISQDPRGSSEQERSEPGSGGPTLGLGYATGFGRKQAGCDAASHLQATDGRPTDWIGHGGEAFNFWSPSELIFCRDFRSRRIEPGSFPLANGIPSRVGPLLTELRKLGRSSIALARANRNIRLKGYGNAINPWVAAQFIRAHRDRRNGLTPTPLPTEAME